MSQTSRAIFGAIAVSLTFGAAQLASGRDLAGPQNASAVHEATINRAAKADRAAVAAGSGLQTQTISLRVEALSDTSVLVRVPVSRQVRSGPSVPLMTKSGNPGQDRKLTMACEPVVSVLTEIARQLQLGRCVT